MSSLGAGQQPPRPSGSSRDRTNIWVRLKTASVTRTTILLVLACVAAQFALGAHPAVLALAIIACVAGLAGFQLAGAYHSAGWLAFFFVLGNVIVALVAKTVFLQPLDSHLYAPLESFLVLAVGSSALLIALLLSLMLPVGKPVFHSITDPRLLRFLSTSTFALGTLFWYLTRLFNDPGGSGFGGLAVFWNLLLMAVIARTAMVMERTDDRRSLDTQLFLILLACVAMGLIDNSKSEVALPIVAYFATCLFYRGGAPLRQVVVGVLGLVIMAALVGPMIHAFRGLGIQDMPWQQRVTLIERGVKDALARRDFASYEKLASGQFLSGYYDYFGQGGGQMLLGRYASIQQIDPVIASVGRHNTLGGTVIWPTFGRLLPSFVYPDKPRRIEGYRLLVQLGLIDPEGGKYPTVPLLAQSYAGYGILGLLVIPFLAFLGLLLALKKLGWTLYRNVFAIFFCCVFTVIYANQGGLAEYAGAVLRNFPLLGGVLWLAIRLYGLRIKSSYPQLEATARQS
jgi:hypothetical protein